MLYAKMLKFISFCPKKLYLYNTEDYKWLTQYDLQKYNYR